MADININNLTKEIQTAAEWAVDAEVKDAGKILITSDVFYNSTDQPKFKLGNGVDTWSNLDYMPLDDQDLSSLALKSNVLDLNNTTAFTPDAEYEPATKKYVDDNITVAPVDSINGETGVVVLTTGDISEDTDANYVTDAQLVVIGDTSGTNTGDQDISGIATNASAITTLDGEVVKKADFTPAHSILVQQSGTGSPESLQVGTNTIVGRVSGGGSEIDDLSPSQVRSLINVEDGADVTDTANVTASGALMDSEVTNLAQVKAFDSTDYATAAQGTTADNALQDVVEDTTPQLGGTLDTQGNAITGNYATDARRALTSETTTARTLALGDAGDFITFENASASTCTIPTNASVAFPTGTEIDIVWLGAGEVTIEGDTGVTLNGVSAGSTAITAQYGGATIKKIATDTWLVFGKINDVA
jgi:hypothetical protein